jgi:hypothetical protein
MRIPLHKVYRAFPELDRFEDEDCERFVVQARRVAIEKRIGRHLLEAVAAASVFLLVIALGMAGFAVLASLSVSWLVMDLAVMVFVSAMAGAPIVSAMMVRDAWLRRAIASRLASARCAACDYSLLGLPVNNGVVMCPECGFELALASYGLRPEDLLSRPAPSESLEGVAVNEYPASGPRTGSDSRSN